MGSDLLGVADMIERLSLWMRRQSPTQVSTTTITTLDTLNSAGPLRISELAEREAMTQPGMTVLINRLESGGLAERIPDPRDGRATLVRILDAGRAVLGERHEARTRALTAELGRLDPVDQRALVAALPALRRLIADEVPVNTVREESTV